MGSLIVGGALAAALVGAAWATAPGWLLRFDVTPKVVAVLAATAVAALFPGAWFPGLRAAWRQPQTRLLLAGLATALLALFISTASSTRPELSWGGTQWRAMGFPVASALLIWSVIALAWSSTSSKGATLVQRWTAAASIPISLYAIGQYFGFDPLTAPETYQASAAQWDVIRPPGTLGHSGYLGVYLAVTLFWAGASRRQSTTTWRGVLLVAMAAAATALLLSGSRGALVGVVAGCGWLLIRRRELFGRRLFAGVALGMLLAAGFVLSPAGTRLRTRIQWSLEDVHGGARPWLWKDSLTMGAARPWTGHGPETFTSAYLPFKSERLAELYPDLYQESPHNPFAEAWTEQGLLGLVAWLLIAAGALWAAWRAPSRGAAFVAGFTAAQFLSWTAATQLYVLAAAVWTLPLRTRETDEADEAQSPRWLPIATAPVALVWIWFAVGLWRSDAAAEQARRSLAQGDLDAAVAQFDRARGAAPTGRDLDAWFSRALAAAIQGDPQSPLWPTALASAERATHTAEHRAHAHFSLAEFYAREDRAADIERELAAAAQADPTWTTPREKLEALRLLRGNGQPTNVDPQPTPTGQR